MLDLLFKVLYLRAPWANPRVPRDIRDRRNALATKGQFELQPLGVLGATRGTGLMLDGRLVIAMDRSVVVKVESVSIGRHYLSAMPGRGRIVNLDTDQGRLKIVVLQYQLDSILRILSGERDVDLPLST